MKLLLDYFKKEKKDKVLVIEPHPYHEVVLPSIVKYFQDLNYDVDLMIRKEVFEQKVFCKVPNKPKMIVYKPEDLKGILSQDKIAEYDFIFCSTLEFAHDGNCGFGFKIIQSFREFWGVKPKTKYGTLGIYHTPGLITKVEDNDFYDEGRVFTTSELNYQGTKTKMLNPHYFGNVKIKKKLNRKLKLIVVGFVKDPALIINTVETLLDSGIKNFEITIICRFPFDYPRHIRRQIKFKQNIDFPHMYKEMEKADFCIPLLDPDNEAHKGYFSSGPTGIYLLMLGFLKPCLINEVFAKLYRLDESNSIIYSKTDLGGAIKQALKVKRKEYNAMQSSLKILREDIHNKSLNNLETTVKYFKAQI